MNRRHPLLEHIFLALIVRLIFGNRVLDESIDSLQLLLATLIASFPMSANLSHVFIILVILIHSRLRKALTRRQISPLYCAWVINAVNISHLHVNLVLFVVHL
jgi:hypothetical protein